MPKLQARFKDSLRLPTKNSAVLMTVISLGNNLQKGDNWNNFFALIENCFAEKTIEKLIIITTGYLQRHYFSLGLQFTLTEQEKEEKALTLDHHWLKKHVDSLTRSTLPIEVIDWKQLLNQTSSTNSLEDFDKFFKQVKEDYSHQDSEFRNLVNEHAVSYVSKKIGNYLKENINTISYDDFLKVSIDYVLEECAAIWQLMKCNGDLLTYPSGMNPPARHIWNKYFKDSPLRYVRYEIKQEKAYSSTSHTHFKPVEKKIMYFKDQEKSHLTYYVKCTLETLEWDPKQELRFIKEFRKLIHQIDNYPIAYQAQQESRMVIHRNSI
ncbi:MAG: hypothetical protein RLZZ225_976 [Pseudomonadota bacterium]|jgi:hypothetical protein